MTTRTADVGDAIHVLVREGDRSFYVKQAKVAVKRFLKAKRPNSTAALRRRISSDSSFGPVMVEAVRLVQEIADLPKSGEITYSVDAELAAYWPRDNRGRRVLRKTAAWKLIPGQLSKNFNIREFACHDGTGYVEGLMREQGLSRAKAMERARGLAGDLEQVRAKGGNRPIRLTSVFRTKRYNKAVGGASNSAHTRGRAADVPPPRGVSLRKHRENMRVSFPCGIGYYPGLNFVHGDRDFTLGRREWEG